MIVRKEFNLIKGEGPIQIKVEDTVTVRDSITLAVRSYFSIQHIISASHFARLSANLEKTNVGKSSENLYFENVAYVTGAIFTSVSFLESLINELFQDAADEQKEHLKNWDPEIVQLIAKMWKLGVPRTTWYSVLEKYQIALALAEKDPFDRGKLPYQDAYLLINLRNALIHYEPETLTVYSDTEKIDIHKFEKMLKGKFPLNPLALSHSFFPNKCLGHGCAEWAVTTSIKFTDKFFSKMGLIPIYEHVRPRLKTK